MDPAKRKAFDALPTLGSSPNTCPACKVCGTPTRLIDAVDFCKCCSAEPYQFGLTGIIVPYFRCPNCQFMFTDLIDDWSATDISRYIYNDDYIKVDPDYIEKRPHRTAAHLAPLLSECRNVRILDYGSGSGVFAQAMTAQGYVSVDSYDPYSSPQPLTGTFDLITCIEVLEHSPQPLHTLTEIAGRLSEKGAILVGQSLQPDDIEVIAGRWWYLAPRNGHVSFYTHETFLALAERSHLKYEGGNGIYAFTHGQVDDSVRQVIEKIRRATLPEDKRRLARARGLRGAWQRAARWVSRHLGGTDA